MLRRPVLAARRGERNGRSECKKRAQLAFDSVLRRYPHDQTNSSVASALHRPGTGPRMSACNSETSVRLRGAWNGETSVSVQRRGDADASEARDQRGGYADAASFPAPRDCEEQSGSGDRMQVKSSFRRVMRGLHATAEDASRLRMRGLHATAEGEKSENVRAQVAKKSQGVATLHNSGRVRTAPHVAKDNRDMAPTLLTTGNAPTSTRKIVGK